jgi:hypothetical protein
MKILIIDSRVVSNLTMKPDEFLGPVFQTNVDILLGLGKWSRALYTYLLPPNTASLNIRS